MPGRFEVVAIRLLAVMFTCIAWFGALIAHGNGSPEMAAYFFGLGLIGLCFLFWLTSGVDRWRNP